MGTVKNFEELAIWKMARELANLIYNDFGNMQRFWIP